MSGSRPRRSLPSRPLHARRYASPSPTNRRSPSATDEDTTLVLAGAGTGKTAVIHRQGRPPGAQRGGAAARDPRAGVQTPPRRRRCEIGCPPTSRRRTCSPSTPSVAASSPTPASRRPSRGSRRTTPRSSAPSTRRFRVSLRTMRRPSAVTDFIANHGAPYRSPFEFNSGGRVLRARTQRRAAHAQRRPREERRGARDRQLPHAQRHRVPLRACLPGADRHARARPVPARLLPPRPRRLHRALRAR